MGCLCGAYTFSMVMTTRFTRRIIHSASMSRQERRTKHVTNDVDPSIVVIRCNIAHGMRLVLSQAHISQMIQQSRKREGRKRVA